MNDDTDGDTMTVETHQGESSFTATVKWSKSLRPEVEPFFAFECKWSIVFFCNLAVGDRTCQETK